MSKSKKLTNDAVAAETETHTQPAAGKHPAHARTMHKSAKVTGANPVSRADLVQLKRDRWLVVSDEHDPKETARCATLALASTGRIYLYAGEVAELKFYGGYVQPRVKVLDLSGIAKALSKSVECVAFDDNTGHLKPGMTDAQLAQLIKIYRPYTELSVLTGVVYGPAKRADGTVIMESGYDDASGLYLADVNANPAGFTCGEYTGDAELDALLLALE